MVSSANTRRSARSASRETSAPPTDVRSTRRGGRTANAESNPNNTAEDTTTRRKTRKKAQTELEPVQENSNPSADQDQSQDAVGASNATFQSPGGASNLSGETAVTPNAAPFASMKIDVSEAAFTLPYLKVAAASVLKTLAPTIPLPVNATKAQIDHVHQTLLTRVAAVLEDLEIQDSKTSLNLRRSEGELDARFKELATEGSFIDPQRFISSLLDTELPHLDQRAFRPDDVIYLANLASLARAAAHAHPATDSTHALLTELNISYSFPQCFVSQFGVFEAGVTSVGCSDLMDETMKLKIEMVTQLLIISLILDTEGSVQSLIEQLFHKEATLEGSQPNLQDWGFQEMSMDQQRAYELQGMVHNRWAEITQLLESNEGNILETLEDRFPLKNFQQTLLAWASMRQRELIGQIEARGGTDAIMEHLELTQQTGIPDPPSQTATAGRRRGTAGTTAHGKRGPRASRARKSTNARGAMDLELAKEMNRRYENQLPMDNLVSQQEQASPAPAAVMHSSQQLAQSAEAINVDPRLQQENWQPAQDLQDRTLRTNEQDPNSVLMSDWQRQALTAHTIYGEVEQSGEPHREPRRFLDRQPGAHRVEWGEDFSQTQGEPVSSALGKRPSRDGDEDDLEPSQDVGFQTDEREIALAPRSRLVANNRSRSRLGQPSPKRIHTDENTPSGSYEPRNVESRGIPAPSDYAEIKKIAKLRRKNAIPSNKADGGLLALPTSSTPIGQRGVGNPSKRSWTSPEEEALLNYIANVGCSWAEIKRVDDALEAGAKLAKWSQVDLKDKAIGMKAHILQSGMALPQNFHEVSLRNRDRDRLLRMGINPDST